jgi:hypothetical protein
MFNISSYKAIKSAHGLAMPFSPEVKGSFCPR